MTSTSERATTFVLVPGAWHGGWWFDDLVDLLRGAGHEAVAVTPDGLDPERPTLAHAIDLDRHVVQVLAEVRAVPAGTGTSCWSGTATPAA